VPARNIPNALTKLSGGQEVGVNKRSARVREPLNDYDLELSLIQAADECREPPARWFELLLERSV
jgi:hypothetical protein